MGSDHGVRIHLGVDTALGGATRTCSPLPALLSNADRWRYAPGAPSRRASAAVMQMPRDLSVPLRVRVLCEVRQDNEGLKLLSTPNNFGLLRVFLAETA